MRQRVARFAIFAISAIVVVAAVIVLLWLAGWWPDRLIPWVPFERV